jgi:hypothetical protein
MAANRNNSTKRLQWHIEAEDYFGTLATVLDLLRQRMELKGYGRHDGDLLEALRNDLVYLQIGYEIVGRQKGKE